MSGVALQEKTQQRQGVIASDACLTELARGTPSSTHPLSNSFSATKGWNLIFLLDSYCLWVATTSVTSKSTVSISSGSNNSSSSSSSGGGSSGSSPGLTIRKQCTTAGPVVTSSLNKPLLCFCLYLFLPLSFSWLASLIPSRKKTHRCCVSYSPLCACGGKTCIVLFFFSGTPHRPVAAERPGFSFTCPGLGDGGGNRGTYLPQE